MYPEPVDSSLLKIDLYSDTATKPTREMREFMCAAEVGDEQRGEDPSVNELQEMVAEMLGKESRIAAAFRHNVQPDCICGTLPPGRYGSPGKERTPAAFRSRRRGGALQRNPVPCRRGQRTVYGGACGGRGPACDPLLAGLSPGRRRADHEPAGRAGLATGTDARGLRCGPRARPAAAHGRRPPVQRGRRVGNPGGGLRGNLRLSLDRSQQGPGRANRGRAGRLDRVYRSRMAMEAEDRRRHAAGRLCRGRGDIRVETQRSTGSRRTTPTPGGWPWVYPTRREFT